MEVVYLPYCFCYFVSGINLAMKKCKFFRFEDDVIIYTNLTYKHEYVHIMIFNYYKMIQLDLVISEIKMVLI